MAIAASIKKTRKDIEKTLADTGALDAVVGTADLAVKKVREARADITARAASIDPKATVAAAPEQLKALPTKAQAVFGEAVSTALTAYTDLAERGNKLVIRVRRQKATQDLKDQAATTKSHAKGTSTTAQKSTRSTKTAVKSATTTAKKSAKNTKTAVKSATTTAKKNAAATKTSAKSTVTSATKTAAAAKKAAEATASKVGN